MLIIDTHCHASLSWSEPVEMLLHQMNTHGVSNAVLIQQSGNYDNSYLLECVRRHKDRFKFVVLLDLLDASRIKLLEELHRKGAAGVRLFIKYAWDPMDPLWKKAGELGMIVSVIGRCDDFASTAFKKLLDCCPQTQFCLEHLARAGRPGAEFAEPPYDGFKAALECARWPSTTLKVPGLGEIVSRPARMPTGYPFDTFPPLFEMAKEAFGVERMMWGSDFPPCAAREGYANALQGVRKYPAFQNGDDLKWIMGKSAARLWGFPA